MQQQLPTTISNSHGEKLTFKALISEADGDRLIVENEVAPRSGPPMHVHHLQDESLTVVEGRIGYQVHGAPEAFAGPGETVTFLRGVPHRFWNAGDGVLRCTGFIKPANTIVFFLSAIYAAQRKSGKPQPEAFDAAYLLTRYKSEYDMLDIPPFVKKVIIPITYRVGKLMGKYRHFSNAPTPVAA